jgi:hypothetical protein
MSKELWGFKKMVKSNSESMIGYILLVAILIVTIIAFIYFYFSGITKINTVDFELNESMNYYSNLNNTYNILNSKYNSLNSAYADLEAQINGVNTNYTSIKNNFTPLKQKYTALLVNYSALQYNTTHPLVRYLFRNYTVNIPASSGEFNTNYGSPFPLVTGPIIYQVQSYTDMQYLGTSIFNISTPYPGYVIVNLLTTAPEGSVEYYFNETFLNGPFSAISSLYQTQSTGVLLDTATPTGYSAYSIYPVGQSKDQLFIVNGNGNAESVTFSVEYISYNVT